MSDRRIAAFDFDGTLTRRDTVVPFLVHAFGLGPVLRAVVAVAPTAVRARLGRGPAGQHHRDVVKAAVLRRLAAGQRPEQVTQAGERFARTLDRRLRPEVLEQIRWHRDQGHELVIVSASLLAYLVPFAAAHGFDHVIGVGLACGPDGRLTGELDGPNVRGPEKAVRLRAWLGREPVSLWAYGNSTGDAELLALADVPVWVTGRRRR